MHRPPETVPRRRLCWTAAALCALLAAACARRGAPEASPVAVLIADLAAPDVLAAANPDRGEAILPARVEDGVVVLAPGARLDFFLELPSQSSFEVASVAGAARPGGLTVSLERAAGGEARRWDLAATDRPATLPLLDAGPDIVRLRLEAPSGARLERPRLTARGSAPPAPAAPLATKGRPPHVVIYLIDALRPDRLGAYGSTRALTPAADALAAGAVVFERARAQSSWTRAAVGSLFTGLWPRRHGAEDRDDALPSSVLTVAELLKAAGYRTAAFITNGNIGPEFGFDQGFELVSRPRDRRVLSDALNERLFAWLDEEGQSAIAAGVPLFLYVHTIDPHAPYQPAEPERSRFAAGVEPQLGRLDRLRELNQAARRRPLPAATIRDLEALYDAEVAFNDRQVELLLDRLRRLGILEETLFVLLADHGEEFWEHGDRGHGRTLYQEVIHIPLIVRPPGGAAATRTADLVQQADLLPTILDYAGLQVPAGLDGRSLRPLLEGRERPAVPVFTRIDLDGNHAVAVEIGRWKLVETRRPDGTVGIELFDVASDAGDRFDLAPRQPIVVGWLRGLLRAADYRAGTTTKVEATIGKELQEELRALGYLQ